MTEPCDVFVSYAQADVETVQSLVRHLQDRGLSVWWAEKSLAPGSVFPELLEEIIAAAPAAAIVVGAGGLSPWQKQEFRLCHQEHMRRQMPVIPVLLPGADASGLPPLMAVFGYVDLRGGVTPERLSRLEWAITGFLAVEVSRSLMLAHTRSELRRDLEAPQFIDLWGMAYLRCTLSAISHVIAQTASQAASAANGFNGSDELARLVPAIFELHWRRGYAAALEPLFKPPAPRDLSSFGLLLPAEPCPVHEGPLEAAEQPGGDVVIRVAGHPAACIPGLPAAERRAVVLAVNGHGRMVDPRPGGDTLIERLGRIPVQVEASASDPLAPALQANREALLPLLARFGIPGCEWLLASGDEFADVPRGDSATNPPPPPADRGRLAVPDAPVDVFDAEAAHPGSAPAEPYTEWLASFKTPRGP